MMTEPQGQLILQRLDALQASVTDLREEMASQRALRSRDADDTRDHESRLRELEKLPALTKAVEALEKNALRREERLGELEQFKAKALWAWTAANGASAFIAWMLTRFGVLP